MVAAVKGLLCDLPNMPNERKVKLRAAADELELCGQTLLKPGVREQVDHCVL
jgi:hypothetical protein